MSLIHQLHKSVTQNVFVKIGCILDRLSYRRLRQYYSLKKEIQKQPLLDANWYFAQYPDVKGLKSHPLHHYYFYGAAEGRNPNPFFDTRWYLTEYPDVADSGTNPLLHYLRYGADEGKNPNPYFDSRWYLSEYPDVAQCGMNPLLHYMSYGADEGRNPNPYFDSRWYLSEYPDVADSGLNPLLHYLRYGVDEGRNPNPYFDSRWYLSEYPDVAQCGMNPLLHYMKYGAGEGRNPNPYFDSRWYLFEYPEVAKSGMNPLLHYIHHGGKEGKNPGPYFDTHWYQIEYQDVVKSGLEPLLHYLKHGKKLGRDTQNASSRQRVALPIVPHYIDAELEVLPSLRANRNITAAIHLHLDYPESLNEIVSRLKSVPVAYDLYVSVTGNYDVEKIEDELKTELKHAGKVIVELVPDRGGDIAPLIIQFGKYLAHYDIFGHFHTMQMMNDIHSTCICSELYDILLGSPGDGGRRVAYIIGLLQGTAKVVYPEDCNKIIRDRSGWSGTYELAKKLLERHTHIGIDDFPVIDFPEGSMFWARTKCLKEYLELPISYKDFPEEPIPPDGTLLHALRRLILFFSGNSDGENIRLHKGDSINDYRHYEEQRDYSESIIHSDIKVLAYYLPQFHPIPENDVWHGEGFTEWTKVRSANPLFKGHYQQHIPHPDMGYYLLDSPLVLKKQTELMRQSGVSGQVFYHYWFSGKLILEAPARLLLDNPDIDMPFCFCWANENWTRRWDGNEKEILLDQKYSADDACAFIRYLIPFFGDSRYIRVNDRPVLFVYRPTSIPNAQEYLDVWEKECRANGIPAPYVVAVLTRGATDPQEFGMDAGVERVLHDWTNGAVPEMKRRLCPYHPIKGSVLSYDEVADFYSGQTASKKFTYFRSVVSMWDNTARYGAEAFLLHCSTPERFQNWLEDIIGYSKINLPEDRRFVLINAWNEWAEGAHLEPDSRFGYSYLNAVGRALSGISSAADLNLFCELPQGLRIHLSFSEFVLQQLQADFELRKRFVFGLLQSSIFKACIISTNALELFKNLAPALQCEQDVAVYILEFRHVSFFDPSIIEKMMMTALVEKSAVVIAYSYGSTDPFADISESGSVDAFVAYDAPLVLFPPASRKNEYKNFKIRTDAHCFITYPGTQPSTEIPEVTAIIRFHKSGSMDELKNALYCLQAMHDCIVVPFIAAQDLNDHQITELKTVLDTIRWRNGIEPRVDFYSSPDGAGDLRSRMLNESLRTVKTHYAAFLDYDDRLMPHAYSWLLGRLKQTGKAVSFGRIFCTAYNGKTGILLDRRPVYEYGSTYDDFLGRNHFPVHSYMLDMDQLDLHDVVYFDDQKFMEDYLLMLQILTRDNADWEGLAQNLYIGDYTHSIDRSHTLAFSNDQDRDSVLSNPDYIRAEKRIIEMRERIEKRGRII